MEKPKLEKVIEKLEKLDIREWKMVDNSYLGPKFTTKTEGLVFCIGKSLNNKLFGKDKLFHYLSINDWEGHIIAEYYNKNKESFEEKNIGMFYNNIHEFLKSEKTAEFSDLLDEFLSEKIDYKTSMKKPELKKIIAKLERIDLEQWKMYKLYYGPDFSLEMNGLVFHLRADKDYSKIKQPSYHGITIRNREGNVLIEYSNSKKDSSEEKEIANLYEKLRYQLEKNREAKFGELINNFLSD